MKIRVLIVLSLLFSLMVVTSCSLGEDTNEIKNNANEFEALAERLLVQIDRTQDYYLTTQADENLAELLILHSITYGSYTSAETSEVLVLFKFMNNPHVSGLDRTLVAIYDADTYTIINQKTFVADEVFIQLLENGNQTNNVLYIGTITYQGFTTYDAQLLEINVNGWSSKNIVNEKLSDNYAYSFSDNVLQVFNLSYDDYHPIYRYEH
jgi:hypothetical protein